MPASKKAQRKAQEAEAQVEEAKAKAEAAAADGEENGADDDDDAAPAEKEITPSPSTAKEAAKPAAAKKGGGKSARAKAAKAKKNAKAAAKTQAKASTKVTTKKDDEDGADEDGEGEDGDQEEKSEGAPAAAAAAKPAAKAAKKDEDKKKTKIDDDYRQATGVLMSNPRALDVKIGAFSLNAWGKELIKDTLIEITVGRRYGLIGSNGCGKSTFLRCLANREVPIPAFIDIHLLEEEAPPLERTPLEYVIDEVKKEVKRLEDAVDVIMEKEGPDSDALTEYYNKLDALDPNTFETRAARLLHGLGFEPPMMKKHTKDMSGGWRMRCALAKALFIKPTLLLLDEPTNHLDLNACVWLEEYLSTYDRALVIVSHSQDFLNGVCTNIIHITPKKTLVNYTGNYDQFVKTKAELEVQQMKKFRKQQEDIKKIKDFAAAAGTYANLKRQAASKLKVVEKMEAAGLVEEVVEEHKHKFVFSEPEMLAPPVLAFYNVGFAYSGNLEKDGLYKGLNLGIDLDSRVALVGPNGAGKSTLLKLIVDELTPTEGTIRRHAALRMSRYHQHSNDQLDSSLTPIQYMMKAFPEKNMELDAWRQHMGRYGVSGNMQMTQISKLSDGQKSRIVFAYLATKNPHLLLLDEPTNHLDMEAIDALADAINKFKGGLVLVSHDFRLIDQVAKEVWVCDRGVKVWPGTIRSYKQSLIKQMKADEKKREEAAKAVRSQAQSS